MDLEDFESLFYVMTVEDWKTTDASDVVLDIDIEPPSKCSNTSSTLLVKVPHVRLTEIYHGTNAYKQMVSRSRSLENWIRHANTFLSWFRFIDKNIFSMYLKAASSLHPPL